MEQICVVNRQNHIVGYEDKDICHDGEGILHRAFSIFIFNSWQQLLIQKRSSQKRLWPLYWSNSCCSHPRRGEHQEAATQRCLENELGIHTALRYLYTFQYHRRFFDIGAEREICAVYIGKYDGAVKVNPAEVAEWRFADPGELDLQIKEKPANFTPWFVMEWETIRSNYAQSVHVLLSGES